MDTLETKEKEFFTIPDLMERWQCSYNAAYSFFHKKDVKMIKPRQKLLVPFADIKKYEKSLQIK